MEFWMFGVFPIMNNKLGVCGGLDEGFSAHKSDMAKFFDMEYCERVLDFSDTLKKLAPTLEEISIIRVILITYTGKFWLNRPNKKMCVFTLHCLILLVKPSNICFCMFSQKKKKKKKKNK